MAEEKLTIRHAESIVPLPIFESETTEPLYPGSLPLFQQARYAANRDLLSYLAQRTVAETNDPLAGGDLLNDYYPVSRIDPDRASALLAAIQSARPFRLKSPIGSRRALEQSLTQNQDQILLTAPTHAADGKVLSHLAQNGVNLGEVGLLVYDSHFDGLHPMGNPITKSSFLSPLLPELASVSFLGIPEDLAYTYTRGPHLWLTGEEQGQLRQLSGQIQTGSKQEREKAVMRVVQELGVPARVLQRYLTHMFGVQPNSRCLDFIPREHFYKDRFLNELPGVVAKMKQRGVKHLYLSFDADVLNLLNEMITATPYSPFSLLLAFGIAEPLNQLDLEKTLLDDAVHVFSQGIQGEKVLTTPSEGLSTESALHSLQYVKQLCSDAGITLGIPYKGKRIWGSVTELDGRDVNENAYRFLQQVNQVMRE